MARRERGIVRGDARALEAEHRSGPALRHFRLLVNEQATLALQTPGVALQRPILANHAMAGNDDGDRIGADRSTDVLGYTGIGMAEGPCEFPVGGRLSGRDLAERRPDLALKVTAIGGDCNI